MKPLVFGVFAVLFISMMIASTASAAEYARITVAPADVDRRFVVIRAAATSTEALSARDAAGGTVLPVQLTTDAAGNAAVCFLIPFMAGGQSPTFILETAAPSSSAATGVALTENNGVLSVTAGSREITRYNFGDLAAKYKKPYFYPLNVGSTNLLRGFPMDPHPGESSDHPHHTGLFFGYSDVDKADYWMNGTVTHDKFLARESGPVFARIAAVDKWGAHVTETRDVTIYNVGDEVLMDWTITLTAFDKPVIFGKTKDGGFAVRVATEITAPEPGGASQPGRGAGKMLDALGNHTEPTIRAKTAGWADDYGVVAGNPVGVAIMVHPSGFRAPPDWHVRNYGLFSASILLNKESFTLDPATPIVLKYRLYAHKGDPIAAHVADVFAGYVQNKTAE